MDAKTYVQSTRLAGTLAFSPPEALKGLGTSAADATATESSFSVHSDVFSFGALVFFSTVHDCVIGSLIFMLTVL